MAASLDPAMSRNHPGANRILICDGLLFDFAGKTSIGK
jgi:hypothetical protein